MPGTAKFGQGLGFDLTDPLAGESELSSQLLKGSRCPLANAEAPPKHSLFSRSKGRQHLSSLPNLVPLHHRYVGGEYAIIFDEVNQLRVAVA